MIKKISTRQNLMLKANDPLVQIIPLTSRDTQLKVEVVSKKYYTKLHQKIGYCITHTNNGLKKIHKDKY